MNDLSAIILKNGINSLIYESDEAFKKSLINSLSFKLNEALKETQSSFSSKMLFDEQTTEVNEDVETLLVFLENYDPESNYSLNLKNNTSINIKEHEAENLKALFNSLKPENRKLMAEETLKNINGLKRTLTFYKMAEKVIK